jgi:large subunit ribosomal protein L16
MGKGKGNVYYWICKIKPGATICEIETKKQKKAIYALRRVQIKIPFDTNVFY